MFQEHLGETVSQSVSATDLIGLSVNVMCLDLTVMAQAISLLVSQFKSVTIKQSMHSKYN